MTRLLYDLCGRDERLRFSPYCWRVRMALAHKGLSVETVPWRFTDKQALAFADYDKVPVLCDGEQVITDSYDILGYLDAAYPDAPILGSGMTRQRALFFKHYVERSVTPSLFRIVALDLLQAIHPEDRDYFRTTREARFGCTLEEFHDPERGRAELHKVLAPLREQLRGSPFIDGEAPSGADYLLFGSAMWAYCVSREAWTTPGDPVDAWFERMLDLHDGLARNALTIRDLP